MATSTLLMNGDVDDTADKRDITTSLGLPKDQSL
jgi:hypothetical protein